MIIGHIDNLSSAGISGWLGSFTSDVFPFITANGKPCNVISTTSFRPDVAEATGLNADTGFIAEVPHLEHSTIEFKLYAITSSGSQLIDCKSFVGGAINPKRFCSVFDALNVARQEKSIAITCSEATNNGISRAYTLYKIVVQQRPAIIIAFDIDLSEPGLWQPLINSDARILVVPWREREVYFKLFKEIGLSFDTLWICGATYQSYELSRHVANENTRFIQDIDVNNIDICDKDSSNKFAYLMGNLFFERIPHRSTSNLALSETLNGTVIHHARMESPVARERQTDLTAVIRIGYLGTVTHRKGLVEAAKVINYINKNSAYNLRFVVGGLYENPQLKDDLKELQCEVHECIDMNCLPDFIQNLDVVISEFPLEKFGGNAHNQKISAKVGDALSNARPILVPASPATAELENVQGVYLFNQETFSQQLIAAITHTAPISLSKELTLDANYQAFAALEEKAALYGPRYQELFGHIYQPVNTQPIANHFEKTNIVLIWKQHDTGLYGRRVDQIARSLVADSCYDNIISLEIITKEQLHSYRANGNKIESDQQYIYSDFFEKQSGIMRDGILFQTIFSDDTEPFASQFNKFIINKRLFPTNTIFILFPAITEFTQLLKLIDGYKTISDIVDNQLSWEIHSPLPLLNQYLTFSHFSEKIIFNSEENRDFFIRKNICAESKVNLVPNWYTPPASYSAITSAVKKSYANILYSGNMNDRIDWSLLKQLHDSTHENIRIHLIGSADKAPNELTELLEAGHKFVYHGPMREIDLLNFSRSCDLAIMPHTADKYSTFMNPMKINMYSAIGLRCISTDIPGIDTESTLLTICKTKEEFIQKTIALLEDTTEVGEPESSSQKDREQAYIDIIGNLAQL